MAFSSALLSFSFPLSSCRCRELRQNKLVPDPSQMVRRTSKKGRSRLPSLSLSLPPPNQPATNTTFALGPTQLVRSQHTSYLFICELLWYRFITRREACGVLVVMI